MLVNEIRVAAFKSLSLAITYSRRGKYHTPVLMGDDGRYWVADTAKNHGKLVKGGYEEVPRELTNLP